MDKRIALSKEDSIIYNHTDELVAKAAGRVDRKRKKPSYQNERYEGLYAANERSAITLILAYGPFGNKLTKLWEENREKAEKYHLKSSKELVVQYATCKNLRQAFLSAVLGEICENESELSELRVETEALAFEGFSKLFDLYENYDKQEVRDRKFNMLMESFTQMYLFGLTSFGASALSRPGVSDGSLETKVHMALSQSILNSITTSTPQCLVSSAMYKTKIELREKSSKQKEFEKRIRSQYFSKLGPAARILDSYLENESRTIQSEMLKDMMFDCGVDLSQLVCQTNITSADVDAIAQILYRYEPRMNETVNADTMIVPLLLSLIAAREIGAFRKEQIKNLLRLHTSRPETVSKRSAKEKGKSHKAYSEIEKKVGALNAENKRLTAEIGKLQKEYKTGLEHENIILQRKLDKAESDKSEAVRRAEEYQHEIERLNKQLGELREEKSSQRGDEEIIDERSFIMMTVSDEFGAGMKRYFPNMTYTNKPVIPVGVKKPIVVTMGLTRHITTQYLDGAGANWLGLWTKNKRNAAAQIRDFLDSLEDESEE